MPNRIIKESICRSEEIDCLSWFEEVLFYRLIVVCDDYGRFDGRPAIIKGSCFPLKDITAKQIENSLNKLSSAGLVRVYEAQGRPYLQMVTWERHQQIRAKKSKFPSPDGACNQLISDDSNCPRNPIQSESNPNRNRDIKTRGEDAVGRFEEFWAAYPLDKNRARSEKAYCEVLFDGVYGEDELVESARNYAEYCRVTGTDKIYHAYNFLLKAAFEDYLPGKYQRPEAPKSKNAFNDFPQREYDYDQMEKKLLGN